jgi:predicted dehydrogenase
MTIRIGIIGCGSIAEFRHAPEYKNNPEAEIVAYFDPNSQRAEKLAGLYGGTVVEDYNAIIEDKTIDAISVCSTNEMHHVITTKALKSGKHVLCEKPIAVSLESAQEMLDAAKNSGKILMIAHNQRLAAAHKKAREILQKGELGRVITFRTTFGHKGPEYWSADKSKTTWFFEKNRSVFGVAGDLGIHKIDLIRYLLDDEIEEVSSMVCSLDKKGADGKPIGVSDNMVCLLKTKKNIIGTLTVSWTYYGPEDNSTTLYCEKGIMKLYAEPTYSIQISNLEEEETLYKIGKIQTNDSQSNSGVIDAFIDSIINKKAPLISGEDGYKGLRVVLAAIQSSETGRTVKI